MQSLSLKVKVPGWSTLATGELAFEDGSIYWTVEDYIQSKRHKRDEDEDVLDDLDLYLRDCEESNTPLAPRPLPVPQAPSQPTKTAPKSFDLGWIENIRKSTWIQSTNSPANYYLVGSDLTFFCVFRLKSGRGYSGLYTVYGQSPKFLEIPKGREYTCEDAQSALLLARPMSLPMYIGIPDTPFGCDEI
jgi:hypothetical protein